MAAKKKNVYEEHLLARLTAEKQRYRKGWDKLICKLQADLDEERILDCQSESPRLQRYARSGELHKFFEGFLRSADDDKDGLRKALRKGSLARAFERGEEDLRYVLRLDYSSTAVALHVEVWIHLRFDPEDGHVKLFFYVNNYSYEYVAEMGLQAVHDKQSYQFLCINVRTGAFIFFPDRASAVFHLHDSYNDTIMAMEEQIVSKGEEVCDRLSLEYVCRQLDREKDYMVSFSRWAEGQLTHRLFRFNYMDEDKNFVLATSLDITPYIRIEKDGSYQVSELLRRYLATAEDLGDEERRRASRLNKILGIDEVGEQDYSGRRILVVEAHEMNIEIAREMLESRGFSLDVAIDGDKAVERFKEAETDSYACLMVSVDEEATDGYETIRRIRAIRRRDSKKVPVIALSVALPEEDAERAKALGIKAHLSKPVSPQKLADVLEKYVK